jgi:Dolichyl-phosphate-mannose-protein mannosyltransferase
MPKYVNLNYIPFIAKRLGHKSIPLLAIPLIISAFTHLWNPIGFPYGPSNDEGIYIRRAMHVLTGQGPQESSLYDHPYFSQFFLAGVFKIIGYPDSLNPSLGNMHSIERLYLVPRILMGILAVADTFLIYRIAEYRYNKTVALIASILFAVMPITWIIRRILLEPIQLPFLLSSILFAVCYTKEAKNKNKHILPILLSGIFLGLAIFTKISLFSMIPLVGFLVYSNNNKNNNSNNNTRNLRAVGLWFIPVILIPLIWPAYAISINQFDLWLHGIYFQTHRGAQTLFESINYDFQTDPLFLSLGIIGLVFAAIRRDAVLLLWTIPFLIFLYFAGFVSYWHLVPLFPVFCIASARPIENLSKMIKRNKKVRQILPLIVICGISIFGLATIAKPMITSNNIFHYRAAAFISQYLHDNTNTNNITLISNPFYSWIPKYGFHLNNYQIVDYYDNILVKTKRVILVADTSWMSKLTHHMLGSNMEQNFILYTKNKIATFGNRYSNVSVYESQDDRNTSFQTTFGPTGNDAFLKYNNITSPNQ